MQYPLISEYIDAIRLAADNFDKLSHLQPVLDGNGTPMMSSGNFAVVFKMHDPQAHKDVAVKCFLKEQEGRAESYQLIAQELAYTSSSFLTPFRYLDKEIFVESQSTNDEEFPVVLMDWVEGETLDRYIQSHLADPNALRLLAFQFSRLASWLLSQPFAHGDLKPDNILVRSDGTLTLVDYDGMYVPTMQGRSARELGSPDFRHPLRTAERFNEHIDDFPLAVILLSLKALSLSPSLWNTYGASDRLLFSATDYRDLSSCAVLQAFPPLLADPEFTRLYALFLLAHSEEGLSNVSFRLLNLKYPELVEEEVLSTEVTYEDLAEGVKDEYGVLYSKDGKRLLEGNLELKEYTVRKGTRVICDRAFYHCSSLTSLTLPFSLQSIGGGAFSDCYSLTSLTLPSSLQSIGDNAFGGCYSLTSLTLPSSLQSIGGGAFGGCVSLTSLTLPSSLQSIGDRAFLGCTSLSSLTLPSSLQSIGNGAFWNCSSLTSLTLPSSLQSIGNGAFSCCNSLTSLTLPSSLQSIEGGAFTGCTSLRSVICNKFYKVIGQMLLSADGTQVIAYWGENSEVTIPEGVQSIGNSAFSSCKSLSSLTLPSSLQSIGGGAFGGCYSLTSLTLPSSLQSIGDYAFYDCNSLTSLTLPSSLQSIGDSAFEYCNSLTSLYIPTGTESHFKSILDAWYHKYLKPVN
jgi:serine/threonine protein kinase